MEGRQKNILIIEDSEINRDLLTDILENEYYLIKAVNGKIGLDIIKEHTADIDLVLLDLNMPVMDGKEVLKALRQDPDLQEIPVIVTTSDAEDEQECLELGASDFIPKPYEPIIVRLRVQSMLHLKETMRSVHQKTTFLQNLNHEIRTPLNAIVGFAQMLGMPDGTWTEKEKEEFNKYVQDNFNTIDLMLNDIFDTADSQNGDFSIVIGQMNVNEVCRNAIAATDYNKSEFVEMQFTSDVDDDFTLESDARRVQQVLTNFLSNAFKNTSRGSVHLHCSLSERPGCLTFSVTDTGTGVPADKAEYIFKRFTKLNEFVPGTGLGLSICRVIAEKIGGEVSLDTSYKDGARFVFALKMQ